VLEKILEPLYNKVLVNIVLKESAIDVYVEVCSKSKVLHASQQSFETTLPDAAMVDFVHSFIKESPYFYIALLDLSSEQGALPTCSKALLAEQCDIDAMEHKCYGEKWSFYTAKTDLYALERAYVEIGVDFLFSPFVMLAKFFKEQIATTMAMYVLVQESALCVMVFESERLLYAKYLEMQSVAHIEVADPETTFSEDEPLIEESSIDLDAVDVMDDFEAIDEMQEMDDLDDLDSLDEIDEFAQESSTSEELSEPQEALSEGSGFNKDYQRYTLHQMVGLWHRLYTMQHYSIMICICISRKSKCHRMPRIYISYDVCCMLPVSRFFIVDINMVMDFCAMGLYMSEMVYYLSCLESQNIPL